VHAKRRKQVGTELLEILALEMEGKKPSLHLLVPPEQGSVPIHQVPPSHMINIIPHRSHWNNNALVL
jgi:hypothetical protein